MDNNFLSAKTVPVLKVPLGQQFDIKTPHSFGGRITSKNKFLRILSERKNNHPVAGPIFIDGIDEGYTVALKIEKISLTGNYFQCISFSTGVFPRFSSTRFPQIYPAGKDININDISLATQANIGFAATTPNRNISTGRAGVHGGNLDFTFLKEGTIIHLPVFYKGALLAIGDVHALQGEGEISGTGAETDAILTISVNKSPFKVKYPLIEDNDNYYFCGWGNTLSSAIRRATLNSLKFMSRSHKTKEETIYLLLGLAANIRLGNSTGRVKTAAVEINKSYVN